MKESRTQNSVKNFSYAAFTQIINTLINFIARTIFIKILGQEYLGVNGLFTNILTVLSFAELGIGNAIIFSMYQPIEQEDKEKLKGLMKLYKKAYKIIGIVVLLIGISVIPFLNFIIKNPPNIPEKLWFIYLLFLINTALSYFFTYKKSIISAHQKEYIINRYKLVFYFIKNFLQILFLVLTKSFIIYLLIQILCTLLENIVSSKKADKMYPYLNDKNFKEISKEEKKNIFKNVKSLVVYKFGSVILNGTDNIIISKLIGVVVVGIYSNYILIITSITSVVGTALSSFTASIGSLNATASAEQKEKVFYEILFITIWVYGFCAVALLTLLNPFIKVWIGNDYLLTYWTVVAIVLHFYINGVQFAGYTFRVTSGLFTKGKIAPIVAAVINIILSIVLGYKYGITGIILATSIARLVSTTWIDPFLLHKYEFKTSVIKFFVKYIKYFIIVLVNYGICCFVTSFIGDRIFDFIIKTIMVTILSNLIFLLAFFRTPVFKMTLNRIKLMISKYKVWS